MLLKERRKKIKYFFIFTVGYLFLSNPVLSIEENTLTIDDIYQSVDEKYPLINITRKERSIADSKLLSIQGAFDPSFNAKGEARPLGYYNNGWYDFYVEQPTTLWGMTFFSGWRLGLGKFASYEGKSETNSLGEYRTGFEIPLLKDGFTDRRRTNIAQAELKQSEADLKIIRKIIDSRQQAASKYWKWVSTAKNYIILKNILDMAIIRDKNLQDIAKLGNIAPVEVIENKRLVYQRQNLLISAERSLEQSANELSIYLRDKEGKRYTPKLSQVPNSINFSVKNSFENNIQKAFNNNPDLKIINNNLESMNTELTYLYNQRLPDINIAMAISQDMGQGSKTREPFVFDAGFRIKAPLWMRSAEGKINEQKAIIEQTALQYNFIKDQIQVDVKNAQIALNPAYKQIELAKQELELSIKLEEAEKEKFKLGDSNILLINIREQTTADAKIREINTIINYNQALADYKAVLSEY
ncbi:MAG: TolC family protein [Candidatus Sericytochromatia bacterium]|nr:TolC family protein [Candidatus Sericytochromatia bacterium]